MRKALIGAVIIAAAAGGTWLAVHHGGKPDYRDPVQLAEALKAAHHGTAASCGKLPGGDYFCDVANSDGASGTYTVHVTPDGSGYQAN